VAQGAVQGYQQASSSSSSGDDSSAKPAVAKRMNAVVYARQHAYCCTVCAHVYREYPSPSHIGACCLMLVRAAVGAAAGRVTSWGAAHAAVLLLCYAWRSACKAACS
jgi:hypothetical protein